MQHDEIIWQVINQHHCSFKVKTKTQNFCRNEHNVTGLCNRSSCPLANSRYATIREHEGVLYLYMKSIERAHAPANLWERIKLPKNYTKALDMIDQRLAHWPKFLVHKNKQRLTKMTQYLIRMRRLALKVKPKLVTIPRRTEKRELKREAKAEVAAKLERAIEKELLQRLQSGTYGDIYNFPMKEYQKVLDMEEMEAADEDEKEEEAMEKQGAEEEEEEDEEGVGKVEYVEDYEEEEEEEEEDLEDVGRGEEEEAEADRGYADEDVPQEEGVSSEEEEEDESEREEEERLQRKRKQAALGRRPGGAVALHEGKDRMREGRVQKKGRQKRAHVEVEYEEERELEPVLAPSY